MLRTDFSKNNCFSKDARSTAPSTSCAHSSALTFNNVVMTGIAAAVSVFLLIVIIGIINSAIIIHSNIIISIIIMFIIMYSVIIMSAVQKNLNIKAKLRKASI